MKCPIRELACLTQWVICQVQSRHSHSERRLGHHVVKQPTAIKQLSEGVAYARLVGAAPTCLVQIT